MFIKYVNQKGEIAAIYNSDEIDSIGRNTSKLEVVLKFKQKAGSTAATARIPMGTMEEVQKVMNQFAKVLDATKVTSEITETETLEGIL